MTVLHGVREEVRVDGDFSAWVSPHLPLMGRVAARLVPAADRDDVVHGARAHRLANGEGRALDTQRARWVVLPPYDGQPDQEAGAAWAAGRLVVWGGAAGVQPAPEPDASRLLGSGAVWTPPTD